MFYSLFSAKELPYSLSGPANTHQEPIDYYDMTQHLSTSKVTQAKYSKHSESRYSYFSLSCLKDIMHHFLKAASVQNAEK